MSGCRVISPLPLVPKSTLNNTANATANTTTLVPMINDHRTFRSFSPNVSTRSGSVARRSEIRTVGISDGSVGKKTVGASASEFGARPGALGTTGVIPLRLHRPAIAFLATSRVPCSDRKYSSLPMVLTTLATPAPITVPATPSVDPNRAAVTAARAAASTEVTRIFFRSSVVFFSLMIPI